jgi:hypothetical protein
VVIKAAIEASFPERAADRPRCDAGKRREARWSLQASDPAQQAARRPPQCCGCMRAPAPPPPPR